jgi:primosomal protein N'
LFPHGAGSQKIYSQLLNNFKKEDVVFIDESEKRLSEKKITQIIENFSKDEKKILLGTIRSLKVIRNIFSERNQKIKVVVLSLGKIAFGKSFESQEKYINLLASLENVASAIYLRKLEKEKDILENFKNQENFLKIETEMRKIFLLPPYRKVLSICFPVHTKKALDKYLEKFFANIYLQTQKGKYCYYHLLLSEEEIFKNNFYFEQLRNFGKFVVSDHIYENFLLKKS